MAHPQLSGLELQGHEGQQYVHQDGGMGVDHDGGKLIGPGQKPPLPGVVIGQVGHTVQRLWGRGAERGNREISNGLLLGNNRNDGVGGF